MVAISAVRASNGAIRSTFPKNAVAFFAGGTEGIGNTVMRKLIENIDSPTVYFSGRSQKKGDAIVAEFSKINPKAKIEFIAGDFTLIQDVDRVAEAVIAKTKNSGIDFVSLSPGFLSWGRHETKEGLDELLTIRYYARFYFLHKIFTALPAAKLPKHVLLVLAGTTEGPVNESDLALSDPVNYGKILPCANHSASFTSLSIEHLAKQYPNTSFVHAYPGLVKTGSITGWISYPWIKFFVDWTLVPLVTPFTVPLEEAGERGLFYLTNARYPSLNAKKGGKGDATPLTQGVQQAKGEGAYFVSRYGEEGEGAIMKEYRERKFDETVWNHALEVWESALKKGN